MSLFPDDSAARKEYPVYSGFIRYFPAAIAKIAHHSYLGNLKHNPSLPLHHDRAKSDDELDALTRHLMEHEVPGYEGELIAMAWRALSALQKHLESKGAPIAPAARNAAKPAPPIVDETTARAMMRDRVIPDEDESATPAELPRERA